MSTIKTPLPPPRPMNASGPPPMTASAPAAQRTIRTRDVKPIVPKITHYAGEKFGKTSLLAYAPDPLIFMVGETGYDTLVSAGRAPSVPAEVITSWQDALDWLDSLIVNPQGRKTVGFDGIGALDRLCQEHVCNRNFKGDWDDPKEGFLAWGANKGHALCATEWTKLLQRLDLLSSKHGIIPILLGHAITQNTPNPTGADFLTYSCDCAKKTWAEIARWSDCIIFGRFHSVVELSKAQKKNSVADQKGKGTGGFTRVIYTEGRDAYIAGNRYGMAPEFSLSDNPAETWPTVWAEITRSKNE